jgi:hypothetical protein
MDNKSEEYIERERVILGQLNALAIYRRDKNLTSVRKLFPQHLQFVVQNNLRDFREVEQELMKELRSLLNNK